MGTFLSPFVKTKYLWFGVPGTRQRIEWFQGFFIVYLFQEIFVFKDFIVIFIKKIYSAEDILSLIVRKELCEVSWSWKQNIRSVNEQKKSSLCWPICFGQYRRTNIVESSFFSKYRNIVKEKGQFDYINP